MTSRQAESISQQLQLSTQLEALYLPQRFRQNWFVADLDAETISALEYKNSDKTKKDYYFSQLFGRGFSQPFLAKFYLSDKIFISTLRTVSWLTPCPELSCILLDWSRTQPKAGGISIVLAPLLSLIFRFQIAQARKLAFAQQLLSGVVDSGSWGGGSQSDIAVRVKVRNEYQYIRAYIHHYIHTSITGAQQGVL